MSFRARLTLFFLLIVVLPMAAVAVLVTQVTGASERGKADARLASGMQTARTLYARELERSAEAARDAAADPRLARALRSNERSRLRAIATAVRRRLDLAAVEIAAPSGAALVEVGAPDAIAASEVALRSSTASLGTLRAGAVSAPGFVRDVQRLTGDDVAILRGGNTLATSRELGGTALPSGGEASDAVLPDGDFRAAAVTLNGAPPGTRLALFVPVDSGGFASARPVVAAALVGFFAIALLFVALLLRSLQGQVRAMLDAARRIGDGDFSREVPIEGRDEMAALAREFNKMSDKLSAQMGELRSQRSELERSIRRVGEAFGSGLDRKAVLDLVAETALPACGAELARFVLAGRELEAEAGTAEGELGARLRKVEARALERGKVEASRGKQVHVLAQPLADSRQPERIVAVMSIARRGSGFDSGQRQMLRYLVNQAWLSVQNIDLHELVSEQAVTDELTGLWNPRRFRELIDKEAARAERFGHELSLLLLDIDDFKRVNDTHGHLQGDEVLREIGRVVKEESRGVDEPARYGGEEFVVALPETGPEGALEVGERIRSRLERSEIPLVDGPGGIRVTASVGVASMPGSARTVRELIAAADAALYRAKRAGKNRSEVAPPGEGAAAGVATQVPPGPRRT